MGLCGCAGALLISMRRRGSDLVLVRWGEKRRRLWFLLDGGRVRVCPALVRRRILGRGVFVHLGRAQRSFHVSANSQGSSFEQLGPEIVMVIEMVWMRPGPLRLKIGLVGGWAMGCRTAGGDFMLVGTPSDAAWRGTYSSPSSGSRVDRRGSAEDGERRLGWSRDVVFLTLTTSVRVCPCMTTSSLRCTWVGLHDMPLNID